MKTRNITALRQEVAALDLANRVKDHQINALWRTVITLRYAVNLQLTQVEQAWLENQPEAEQQSIKQVGAATHNALIRQAVLEVSGVPRTTTSNTINTVTIKDTTPKKRVRVKDTSSNKRWTRSETQQLHRFKAKGYDWNEISQRLNRSAKACQMQFYKTKNSQ